MLEEALQVQVPAMGPPLGLQCFGPCTSLPPESAELQSRTHWHLGMLHAVHLWQEHYIPAAARLFYLYAVSLGSDCLTLLMLRVSMGS